VCADLRETSDEADSRPTQEAINDGLGAEDEKPQAMLVETDMTSTESVENLIKKAVEAYGRLNIMVNNAILAEAQTDPIFPRIQDTPEWVWDHDMAVNAKGVWLGMKYAVKQMLSQPAREGDRGWM
jgi:NAD(P)-dependent dehydrogenase (short-subunit alcohol dehydrogenase family)